MVQGGLEARNWSIPCSKSFRNFILEEHPAALDRGEYGIALALVDPVAQRRPWRLAIATPEKEGRYQIMKLWKIRLPLHLGGKMLPCVYESACKALGCSGSRCSLDR